MDPRMETLRKISSQRLPPPVLFQGPPSHNASNISIPPPPASVGVSPGGGRTGPGPGPGRGGSQSPPLHRNRSARGGGLETSGGGTFGSPFLTRKQSKGDIDGSDVIWQEMQSALSEVELSATTGEHVFGEKHSEALEDLRAKQLKLAQAWARSEAADDKAVDTKEAAPPAKGAAAAAAPQGQGARGVAGPGVSGESGPVEDGGAARNLDEETEKDILLARERREANDRYFDRVNNGVLDVVAKLEEVAQAMRAVERESQDIWSDTDSVS
ncbi:DUF5315 domain-containing protein, partial [Aspergillus brunneoviolaceus CBS 621.78]